MAVSAPTFDLIILGASGFTGKYVLKEALKFLNNTSSSSSTLKFNSIAIAGRNPSKLTQTLQMGDPTRLATAHSILTADTASPPSLCAQTRLILNCVGPFRRYGEPVVAACAETGCDCLDITGESEFMDRVERGYHEMALKNGSLVISACGFDSVPAEMGVLFNLKQWVNRSVPNRIEAYLTVESEKKVVGNYGTYDSAVLAVADLKEMRMRRSTHATTRAKPVIPGAPPKGEIIEHQKKIGLWGVMLPSADSTVVGRTFSILTENPHGLPGLNESAEMVEKRKAFWSSVKPAHFGVKIGSKSLLRILGYIIFGIIIGLLGSTTFGRRLLLKYPSIFSVGAFSKKGPTEEEMESASFKCGLLDMVLAMRVLLHRETQNLTWKL